MKTNNNIPAYRFQGFEDDWEEVKLGEVLVEYNKKSEIENQFELLSSTNSGIEPRSGRVSGESNIGYKIIKRGMVVLSPQNLWLGNINYNAKFEIGIVSPSYKVFNINGPNELYLATVLRLPKMFFEYAQASVQGASIVRRNLDLDLFGSILVQFPSLPEQSAIGTFFSNLDRHITLHQRKLDTLKEQKKTYLKLLFPAKGQTKPALRFQGFEDDWKEVKLGEVLVEYNKKSEIENQFELLSSTNSGIEPRSGRVSGESNIGYKIIKRGMVVLSPQNLWLGNINYNAKFEIGIVSPSYKVFNINGPNELYLATVLRLPKMFFEYAQASVQGASIVRRNLDLDLFGSILVQFPSLPEQSAIGTFFSNLDRHITLHQRKLDTLKEQKKTYLKLLFPAKGQTKPALRFQGFEDDWKEVKLGEVLVEYNKKSEIENQFELLSSTNSGIEPRSGRVSGESNIGYKIIKRGMVVLSPQNLWLGNINYNAKFEIGIVSPSYKVFNINGPNELYLATVLRLPKMFFEYAQASVQGASIVRRNLDLDLFGSILVQLPSLPEQEAIGSFFSTLDQKIAQVEDKLASLKEMKKTLLRKLFV